MKDNEAYKNTSIGLIPSDWEVKRLGDFVNISSGVSPSSLKLSGVKKKYPYLKVEDLNNCDKYQVSSREYSDEEKSIIAKNSVIFPKRGAAILNNKVRINSVPVQMDSNMMALTPVNGKLFTEYLFYTIIRVQLFKIADTSSIPQINNKHILPFLFPLPPLPEQQKIALILSTWDTAIDNCKAIIEELKVRNKGLARQLLSGKMRINGFEESKWVEKKGNKIFRNNTDKTHNGDLEILSATQERGVIPRSMNNIDIKYDKSSLGTYKKVEVGDYVISLRSFQGGIEYSEYEGIVSPAYTILKEITPISKKFYKVYFKTETFINRLNTIIYGIRDGKQISFSDFATLNIPYPSIEEQNEIAIILDKATEELNQYQQKLQTLQLQKKGLMQQLLTGKVRVKI